MTPDLHAALRDLPKVLLHEHLDGGIRPATLLDLLRRRGIAAPADDVDGLVAWLDGRAHAGSLEAYLQGFALTVAAMADEEALARVAFEAAEDARAEGVVLAEFRIAPALFEPFGIPVDRAIDALLAGLQRSALPAGLIVCAMRDHPPEEVARSVAAAIRHAGRGVVAFDLAGREAGFPPAVHGRALAMAREAGLALTLHAGEADAGERVLEAAQHGARRVGHGIRLADLLVGSAEQAAIVREVIDLGVHLEVCVTSNLHTGAVHRLEAHPIRALWDAGVDLSFHTDNRLISGVTQTGEAIALATRLGFAIDDLQVMSARAARASFLPEAVRAEAAARIEAWRAAPSSGSPRLD